MPNPPAHSRPVPGARLLVRWTIGDASAAGYEALRLSVAGAMRLFGPEARYVVCVNAISLEDARRRAGPLSAALAWRGPDPVLPPALAPFLSAGMSEGTAWKLVPPRLDPDAFELALDNDVILWRLPEALRRWLAEPEARHCVIAADVTPAHGAFAALCGPEPRNSGIRALPPGFDYAGALAAVLAEHPAALTSELDEQGLQVAALYRGGAPLVVTTDEVSICSPFHPHNAERGTCGAHYVGLNVHHIPWRYYDRPALAVRLEHWEAHREALYALVGFVPPSELAAAR